MADTAQELQDSSFFVQLVYPAMEALDLDVSSIAQRCRITPELLENSQERFPHRAQQQFWAVVEEESGDSLIGLHLAEKMSLNRGQVWEYLFLSSPTFGDGLQRTLNFQRLVSDASQWHLAVEHDQAYLCLQFAAGHRHLAEAATLCLVRYFKSLTQNAFAPLRVSFAHSMAGDEQDYLQAFNCEVCFNEESPGIYFDVAVLEQPSSRAEPELLRLHEQLANERLARLQRQDIVVAVRGAIAEVLERGQPELADIARRLGLSSRVLRSRLSEAGTTFNQVLADYRCYLAKRLLSRTGESIGDIVYLTGFSEPSTFYRAFKRWTEMTPVEYRDYKHRQKSS